MRSPALPLALALAACGSGTEPTTAREHGARLFSDPGLADSRFNSFSCATCHATTQAPPPGLLSSGYTLFDTAVRPSWWGGYEARLIDAVNFCFVSFMRGVAPLQPEEDRAKALYEYLASISPSPAAEALPLTIVQDIRDVPRGDPGRGELVYAGACRVCHGALHTGEGQLTPLAVILPEYFSTYPDQFPDVPAAEVVIEKIRHGQFFRVGGTMPPYSLEALGDDDLGALLSYLGI